MVAKRKFSKHSRAARQGALDAFEPEVESLSKLPRAENTNLSNILIRTASKNKSLLDAKIAKEKQKKLDKKKTLTDEKLLKINNAIDKQKLVRSLKIIHKLDGKISKSIARAKFVQSTRKAGWDLINKKITQSIVTAEVPKQKNVNDLNRVDEDLPEADYIVVQEEEETKKEMPTKSILQDTNMFAILSTDVEE